MKKRKKPKQPKPAPPEKKKVKIYSWMRKPDYPVMEPHEYEQARIHYDLPSTRFAAVWGIGWRQGQRYRDGEAKIPDTLAKLIRTAIRYKLHPKDIG